MSPNSATSPPTPAGPAPGDAPLDAQADAITAALDQLAAAPDPRERLAAYRRARDLVRRFAAEPAWTGHPVARELLDETLELATRLEEDPGGEDPEWRVRESRDQLADLVATLLREVEHEQLDDPPAAARFVVDALGEAEQRDVAALLGVDARTVRTWRRQPPAALRKEPERAVLVAQLVSELRRSMTPHGIVRWFRRPRGALDHRSPLELLDERGAEAAARHLRPLARAVRGQLAA